MNRHDADDDRRPEAAESATHHDDEERAREHKLDRMAPSRRSVWPKDDRRSSERVSGPEEGQARRWEDGLPEGGPFQ